MCDPIELREPQIHRVCVCVCVCVYVCVYQLTVFGCLRIRQYDLCNISKY